MRFPHRRILVATAAIGSLTLISACGSSSDSHDAALVEASEIPTSDDVAANTATPSGSASASPSGSASTIASSSPSPSASVGAGKHTTNSPQPDTAATAKSAADSSDHTQQQTTGGGTKAPTPSAPDFPVPVSVGNATQIITVKASGSYATVTAWAKSPAGWKAQFSTSAGRVGSNGVTDGATRRQSTYTTPTGTYSITEGFGVESGGTAMPYTVVDGSDWWVEDPESKYYNQMHSAQGADFPLTEAGERGSERLINYPTQYAKALVINFNRWPAVPGRGAGIFLHINGNGATAGCVSIPRATMDQIMTWIKPSNHPKIAIG